MIMKEILGQISLFDILGKKKTNEHGCYLYAYVKNGVPYNTYSCDKECCKNCQIDRDYASLKKAYVEQGYSFFDAIKKAKDEIHVRYSLFTA